MLYNTGKWYKVGFSKLCMYWQKYKHLAVELRLFPAATAQ
jgi:hypothetical protein